MNKYKASKLAWDFGTAYDLFVSLHVLHEPDKFGLRGSWAAGVRSRIPFEERKTLEAAETSIRTPLHWIHNLPEPKDSAAALWSLSQIAPEERLPALALNTETPADAAEILVSTANRRSWDEKDLEAMRVAYQSKQAPPRTKALTTMLECWSRPEKFGEDYLNALRSYVQVFFSEEENRICSALEDAQQRSQEMAESMALPDLLEALSQGVRFATLPELTELILAPSYWSTPLVFYRLIDEKRMLLLYGARPSNVSLVPGEVIPDALLRALKALADPTRLRILHYLADSPQTPAQLSRRLRLRPPTVVHHLSVLRLAGLVYLTLEAGDERRYAARVEMLSSTFEQLKGFIDAGAPKPTPVD